MGDRVGKVVEASLELIRPSNRCLLRLKIVFENKNGIAWKAPDGFRMMGGQDHWHAVLQPT